MSRPQPPRSSLEPAEKLPVWQSGWFNTLGRFLALAVVFLFFALLVEEGKFYSLRNLENILRQSAVYATAALGMTMVIIAAGIDLSIGSIIALTVVVTAWVLNLHYETAPAGGVQTETVYLIHQWPAALPIVAVMAAIVVATLAGALNGATIVGLRLVPFIVTLGTMGVLRGLAKGIANEKDIYPPEDTWITGIMEPVINTPAAKAAVVGLGFWLVVLIVLGALAALLYLPRIAADPLPGRARRRPAEILSPLRRLSEVVEPWALGSATLLILTFVGGFAGWQTLTERLWMRIAALTLSILWVIVAFFFVGKTMRQRLLLINLGLLAIGLAAELYFVCNVGVRVLLVAAAGAALLLRYTRLGRHIFAVGSNQETARLCGVPVGRTKVIVYSLAGFFGGLAGLMQFSFIGGIGQPTTAITYELFIIAAVVIGGGSLMGGEGSILGSVIGALIITILYMGGQQMGWPKWVQEMVIGAIIIGAVALDKLRHRRAT